jgi:hypothetical protein
VRTAAAKGTGARAHTPTRAAAIVALARCTPAVVRLTTNDFRCSVGLSSSAHTSKIFGWFVKASPIVGSMKKNLSPT